MNGGLVWSPPRPRLFFMHLPKTAGMALRLFLGNQYPVDRIMPANDWRELLSVEIADLDRYSLFQGHFSCGLMDLLPPDVAPIDRVSARTGRPHGLASKAHAPRSELLPGWLPAR